MRHILNTNLSTIIARSAETETGAEAPATEVPATETAAPAKQFAGRLTPEQIKEIRELRAESKPEGGPVYSHAALAARFGTNPGAISQIVRNRSYKDENYVPTNDR